MIGAISLLTTTIFKSNDAYKIAVQRAETNEQIRNVLGTPITESRRVPGEMSGSRAEMIVGIGGPKGKGVIFLDATKSRGVWTYSSLRVYVWNTGQVIDLREPNP